VPLVLSETVPNDFPNQSASDVAESKNAPSIDESLLAGLNPAQRDAVLCTGVPLVIVAGPGTGKTRTLTVRIAHLIVAHGVAPEAVLAITFTNKAANEMAERLAALLGTAVAARVTVSTFHAFGAQLLRTWAAEARLDPDFAICTDQDRLALLRDACHELTPADAERLLARISEAKNRLQGPAEVAARAPGEADLSTVYACYDGGPAANLRSTSTTCFCAPCACWSQRRGAGRVDARYRWISVDEYQDVNLAQVRLLRLLPAGGANLCVIGDPTRPSTASAGPTAVYFLAFQQDYPDARRLRLNENYRSTQLILDAACR
jgi:DNA helicase II / ATP-dependent DNA helicase PcrA